MLRITKLENEGKHRTHHNPDDPKPAPCHHHLPPTWGILSPVLAMLLKECRMGQYLSTGGSLHRRPHKPQYTGIFIVRTPKEGTSRFGNLHIWDSSVCRHGARCSPKRRLCGEVLKIRFNPIDCKRRFNLCNNKSSFVGTPARDRPS